MAKYNADQMKSMAAKGQAMKNAKGEPSYPIADEEDLSNAIHAVGRGGSSHDAIRRHIIARAKALGLSSRIPDNWNPDGSMSDSNGRSAVWGDTERRYTPGVVEYRTSADGRHIGGYAIVFDKLSRNLGGFVERAAPGVINQSRQMGWPGVVCRFNHDTNMILGTSAARTLTLQPDNVGLDYDVDPPQARNDIVELCQRGDIRHSSFAFRVPAGGDEWGVTDQNYPLRTLHEVQLVDVAPVLDPAYPDATAGLRSLAAHFDADPEEVRTMAAQDELRRFFVRTDNRGAPVKPPKPKVPAAVAMMQLMEKRRDPYADQA